MHMTKLKLVFLTAAAFTVGGPLSGQTPAAGLEFLPGGGIFIPPLGHYREARTGVRGELGTTRLKVDIGTSLDILEYRPDAGGDSRLRLGAEFFVYALTTSYSGNRLQVDATDGFFGGHILWRKDLPEDRVDIRLRIIHLSSHMVDGHYDPNTGTWLDGRDPIPFTRDFGELTLAWSRGIGELEARLYLGISYSTLVRPSTLKRWGSIQGIELTSGSMLGTAMGKPATAFLAYNLTLEGIPEYIGTNNIEGGVKFGAWEGAGVRLYASYVAGQQMFCQYYDQRTRHWGIGFTLDLW